MLANTTIGDVYIGHDGRLRCLRHDKVVHDSREQAEAKIGELERDRTDTRRLRVYRCADGVGWHLGKHGGRYGGRS